MAYNRHNYVDGDVLSAYELNQMEDKLATSADVNAAYEPAKWTQLIDEPNDRYPKGGSFEYGGYENGIIKVIRNDQASNANSYIRFVTHTVKAGHVYYAAFDLRHNDAQERSCWLRVYSPSQEWGRLLATPNEWTHYAKVAAYNKDADAETWIGIYIYHTIAEGTLVEVKNHNFIDLTELFGAGNEPATAEEFEAMFPPKKHPYSENTDIDVPFLTAVRRMADIETMAMMAYVNSEYAAALAELEV